VASAKALVIDGAFVKRIPAGAEPSSARTRFTAMTEEKRIIPRRRVLKGGKIISADDAQVIDCMIRNMSVGGARLEVPTTIPIPHEFTLLDVQTGRRYPAKMAWRRGEQMGVEFGDEPEPEDEES
jgi:hypothetical protein